MTSAHSINWSEDRGLSEAAGHRGRPEMAAEVTLWQGC
jgi:hypothetical protein